METELGTDLAEILVACEKIRASIVMSRRFGLVTLIMCSILPFVSLVVGGDRLLDFDFVVLSAAIVVCLVWFMGMCGESKVKTREIVLLCQTITSERLSELITFAEAVPKGYAFEYPVLSRISKLLDDEPGSTNNSGGLLVSATPCCKVCDRDVRLAFALSTNRVRNNEHGSLDSAKADFQKANNAELKLVASSWLAYVIVICSGRFTGLNGALDTVIFMAPFSLWYLYGLGATRYLKRRVTEPFWTKLFAQLAGGDIALLPTVLDSLTPVTQYIHSLNDIFYAFTLVVRRYPGENLLTAGTVNKLIRIASGRKIITAAFVLDPPRNRTDPIVEDPVSCLARDMIMTTIICAERYGNSLTVPLLRSLGKSLNRAGAPTEFKIALRGAIDKLTTPLSDDRTLLRLTDDANLLLRADDDLPQKNT